MRYRIAAFLALLVAPLLSCATSEPFDGLPFIEDDYAAAVAQASERSLPIFVESWAPW